MPPKNKSSASSATKKKQARKAEKRQQQQLEEAEQENDINGDGEIQPEAANGDVQTTSEHADAPPTPSQPPSLPPPSKPRSTPSSSSKQFKEQLPAQSKQRGEKKNSKKQSKKHKKGEAPPPPRKKQYIPPPKPPRDNVDPVDIYGLGVTGTGYERVSAERVITLRLLNKKDSSSVERGVDELASWITSISSDNADESECQQVTEMLPVWAHHLPRLLSHTSRRVRLGSATIHAHLQHAGPSTLLNDYTLPSLNAPVTLEADDYLAALLCAAFDPDRQVRTVSIATWQALQKQISFPEYLPTILGSLNSTILEDASNDSTGLTPAKQAKLDPEVRLALQEDQDQRRNHLAASIDAYTYLLDQHIAAAEGDVSTQELFEPVLTSTERFWPYLLQSRMEASQVRRAVWRCLDKALAKELAAEYLEGDLAEVSRTVLVAACSERDFNTQSVAYPIAVHFLQKYGQAWHLASPMDDDKSSSDDSDTEGEEDGVMNGRLSTTKAQPIAPTVQGFLDLMQVGFYGNANAGYPQVVALLQTMPSNTWTSAHNLDLLFASLWAGYTGRAIEAAGQQGLQAFTGCLRSLLRAFATPNAGEAIMQVLAEQLQTMWSYFLGKVPSPSRLQSMAKPGVTPDLVEMTSTIAASSDEGAWSAVERFIVDEVSASVDSSDRRRFELLEVIDSAAASSNLPRIEQLAATLRGKAISAALSDLQQEKATNFLLNTFERSHDSILKDDSLIKNINSAILASPLDSLPILEPYLRIRQSPQVQEQAWSSAVTALRREIAQNGVISLKHIERIADVDKLAGIVTNAGLDQELAAAIKASVSSPGPISEDNLRALAVFIGHPAPIASQDFGALAVTAVAQIADDASSEGMRAFDSSGPPLGLRKALQLLGRMDASLLQLAQTDLPVSVTAFEVAYILYVQPSTKDANAVQQLALSLWSRSSTGPGALDLRDLAAIIAARLGSLLMDPICSASPFVLYEALEKLFIMEGIAPKNVISAFLPSADVMNELGESCEGTSAASLLSIREPLVPPAPSVEETEDLERMLQSRTFTKYSRATLAFVLVLSDFRSIAPSYLWMVEHLLAISTLLNDATFLGIVKPLPVQDARAIAGLTDRAAAHIVAQYARTVPDAWHDQAIAALRANKAGSDTLVALLIRLVDLSKAPKPTTASRVLAQVMSLLIRYLDTSAVQAERWFSLAQSWQKSNPETCLALLSAVVPAIADGTKVQRYQSELANDISGLTIKDVEVRGADLIRLFLVLASAERDSELLPANRAMFLLQATQRWLLSEEEDVDLSENIQILLLKLFTSLVITIEGVAGSHWEVCADLAESIIESSEWSDRNSLAGLHAACLMVQRMQDRSAVNSKFRASIAPVLERLVAALQDKFSQAAEVTPTGPAVAVLELLSQVLRHVDLRKANLHQLVRLTGSPSPAVQHSAFRLAQTAIAASNGDLVLQVETRRAEEEAPPLAIALPDSLVALVSTQPSDDTPSLMKKQQLLAWLLVFDHFTDVTAQIRSAYLDRLRKEDAIGTNFFPTIFGLLEVTERSRGIDLSGWQIEEYDLNDAAEDSVHLPLLAAYVLYRALQVVPSLIRSEWESIKSKQYSSAIANYVSRNFSPILVAAELDMVRVEQAKDTLNDDNLTIKILAGVNEVKATYVVDEQPMELSVRLPSEFPLQGVEVKEGKKVGVPESTWRAWMLNVQLVISSQNGSIADALSLFKANASRHFEGVEACAICYSVISVTDRSLPTKRCRTCKNLFHPSCLFKWFSTSRGSSCPLCRSLF